MSNTRLQCSAHVVGCTQVVLKRSAANAKSKMEVEPIFTSMDLPTDVFEDLPCQVSILPGMGSPGLQGWSLGLSKASRYEIWDVWTVPVARQGTLEGWVRSIQASGRPSMLPAGIGIQARVPGGRRLPPNGRANLRALSDRQLL